VLGDEMDPGKVMEDPVDIEALLETLFLFGSSAASMQKFTLAHLTQNHDVGELLAAPLGRGLVAYFTHN
jgi:hypothetical protein